MKQINELIITGMSVYDCNSQVHYSKKTKPKQVTYFANYENYMIYLIYILSFLQLCGII